MLLSEEQKQRYRAFWDRTPTDRACLYIKMWDGAPSFEKAASAEQNWTDLEYREKKTLYEIEHTKYFAEGFPSVFTNFGPGNLAACINGYFSVNMRTVWFETDPPFISDFEKFPSPVIDEKTRMYNLVEDFSKRLLSHKDKLITSVCDIGGTYDIIASLRKTENLLYDMYDYPEEIKAFRKELAAVWKKYYFEQTNRLFKEQGCMTSWMSIWSDKTYYPLQCDYSAMISADMFKEFILPDLKEQTEYLDRAIYHLDGPGELPHVDHLLSLPRLNAIQWTSGAGREECSDECWFELFERIQRAGKGIILLTPRIDQLEKLFKHISQRGLYLYFDVKYEKEAKEIIDMAQKLNKEVK